jgi:three-Cys-motif partner protein
VAAPKTTIWKLEPHTRAKHAILRRYLQAWTAILTQGGFPQVAYIDGFAGPGRYSVGEEGSPIIALHAALDHRARISGTVIFLFVEADPERARVLQETINSLVVTEKFRTRVAAGQTFEEAFNEFAEFYRKRGKPLPPTFAFIDPFGWSGVPFSVIKFILSQPSCEVFINFMYEEINRFLRHPDQIANFDSFFGTPEWRQGNALVSPKERNRFLHDLYMRQLHETARARYVRSFEMRNDSGVVDYYLFYATNSLLGLKKMKEAMWKVDESGEFSFSDATDPDQIVLFSRQPNYRDLQRRLLARFGGSETTHATVEEFVVTETAFRETHYKQILKALEIAEPPQLQVFGPANRRKGTFASSTLRLRFAGRT